MASSADISEPRADLGDPVRIGRGLRLRHQRRALGIGGEHDLDQRLRAAWRLLRDAADAPAPGQADIAALGAEIAGDDLEQRGLAGAVAADEADARAVRDGGAGMVEQQAFAEAVGDVVDRQHGALV